MRQNRSSKSNKHSQKSEHHEFAFFYPRVTQEIASAPIDTVVAITDPDVFHRVSRVVRLEPGQDFILFDRLKSVQLTLQGFKNGQVTACVVAQALNKQLEPRITFVLPLLKREAFQEALYSLVELGATVIQPVVTQKAQRAWGGEHEYERSMNVMVAAAEQSKHFSFSELAQPYSFDEWCKKIADKPGAKIFFDPAGKPMPAVLEVVAQQKLSELTLMIGPEGDLTDQEKEKLISLGFIFCSLTPTILRACQAAGVAMGIFRSCLR